MHVNREVTEPAILIEQGNSRSRAILWAKKVDYDQAERLWAKVKRSNGH